jgi:hypothetical protein
MPIEESFTVEEVAKALKVSKDTVNHFILWAKFG